MLSLPSLAVSNHGVTSGNPRVDRTSRAQRTRPESDPSIQDGSPPSHPCIHVCTSSYMDSKASRVPAPPYVSGTYDAISAQVPYHDSCLKSLLLVI